jgi:hypothetical protein
MMEASQIFRAFDLNYSGTLVCRPTFLPAIIGLTCVCSQLSGLL